ncbi:uncharacterized protein LOC126264655 [Aethina tumida]|uniref:uncharacterized protein LOC126264655 n=1 Tax=Aethina tumida TaxID=116153 RepID=UPI0021490637|nr:uncharacterized protein LOC126264655 [Aethina tumida]
MGISEVTQRKSGRVRKAPLRYGYRIVDIRYFLNITTKIQVQHNKRCTGGQLVYLKEVRYGGWSKRSYGHTYNANSGAAVIIGKTTGKVLFMVIPQFLKILKKRYHMDTSACKQYLCTNTGDVSNDRTTQLISSGLHHHLFGAIEQLLMKADLLLDKETNNKAEIFMNIMARFNMGKRLNLIQRNSFQIRAHLSVLSYNYGSDWNYF